MRMIDIIEKKHDGRTLTTEEVNFFIGDYVKRGIPDHQASNLAIAVYFQNTNDDGRAALTMAMANSGGMADLNDIKGVKVDKYSTGGVGNTTTLVLAPLVATADVPVAKMGGHGSGHTGGTIDELKAINGFHVGIDEVTFVELVNENKAAVVGQSGNLTPADKKLYALKDVTGTVDSIPLIASSTTNKEIAVDADAIVLDVKTGGGTFMKTLEDAEALTHTVVRTGSNVGRNAMAIISDINQSLGHAVGSALKLQETVDTSKGQSPKGLTELILILGSQMVVPANKAEMLEEVRALLIEATNPDAALEKFKTFTKNQSDDGTVIDHPERLPQAQYQIEYEAKKSDYVTELVSNDISIASMMLRVGHLTKEDDTDLAVGIALNKEIGDEVEEGESLLTIRNNHQDVDDVVKKLDSSITIADHVVSPTLVHKIITE